MFASLPYLPSPNDERFLLLKPVRFYPAWDQLQLAQLQLAHRGAHSPKPLAFLRPKVSLTKATASHIT